MLLSKTFYWQNKETLMNDLKSALTEYSEKFVATTRKTVDKIENFRKINRCALVYDRGKYTILPPVLGI